VITVLCGGVGGARFLAGLTAEVGQWAVSAVVNTGDDFSLHGLYISPDLDTVTYTLAGEANPDTGWGLKNETWRAMYMLERLAGPSRSWFRLGDADLGTHLYRTGRLAEGATLSEVTAEVVAALGLSVRLLPMSDDPVRTTLLLTDSRRVSFQEYFVQLRHEVAVKEVSYEQTAGAKPTSQVVSALEDSSLVVLAPSNPVLSIDPVLSLPGVRQVLASRRESVVAVSPIVAGAALRGPADRLMRELGEEATAAGVARHLAEVIGTLVIDEADAALADPVSSTGVRPVVADTVMANEARARSLARTVLAAATA
jgi:LPPG:FO 2-phospho-L-lactate transferase